MKIPMLIAALLAVLVSAAHSYLGERYILTRLFKRTELPKLFGGTEFTKGTLRFAWHITSIGWLGFAAIIVLLGSSASISARSVASVVSVTFFVSGLIALVASRGRHLSWIVFFAIAALVWLG